MSSLRLSLLSLLLFVLSSGSASAQDALDPSPLAGVFPQGFDQAIYKGVVGNVLDVIPMDPAQRLDLQRTNAVVGNTLLGRSLTVLVGLSNPILLVGGFIWGLWAASNIKPLEAGAKLAAELRRPGVIADQERRVAPLVRSSNVDDAPVYNMREPVLATSISSVDPHLAAVSSSLVIKIWLPQHSTEPSR